MKLMSLKQYKKMSKTALMRKITKTLRAMPKAKLALLCYNLTKAKLPRLPPTFFGDEPLAYKKAVMSQKKFKGLKPYYVTKRKVKRKFSAKQLAAQRLFAKRAKAGTLRRKR